MVGALKIDRGFPGRPADVAATVARAEDDGFDGCWTGEINHDPFLGALLAAEHSRTVSIGTSITVAFARNPMTLAQSAWDLADYSGGRFLLGLGTQIRPHIEKRFGMPWSRPVARMAEYIAALREIWRCWRTGDRLSFTGEFYTHSLMTPMFTPEPTEVADPPILLAAVGPAMTTLCGRATDGMLVHAFSTARYFDEVSAPALQAGLDGAGRSRGELTVAAPVFIATGRDENEMASAADRLRSQIAFYASTPAYRPVLDVHGWGELQPELRQCSRDGDWAGMGQRIDDEVLSAFGVVAPPEQVAGALIQRCAGRIDRVLPGFAAGTDEGLAAEILDDLRNQIRSQER
ncbi:MAG: TIGR03617 family F420-dependent LLM class oxidoreductase [Mycolicibacterium insubricum]|nr:TIGR03617 family F420-dependent LLM class oxidoreductase [Mycobacterium sp.]